MGKNSKSTPNCFKVSSRSSSICHRQVLVVVYLVFMSKTLPSLADIIKPVIFIPEDALLPTYSPIHGGHYSRHVIQVYRLPFQEEVEHEKSIMSEVVLPKGCREHLAINTRQRQRRELRGQQTSKLSESNTTDRNVLLAFKDAIENVLIWILVTWNSTTSPNVWSGWEGVMCNDAQQVVVLDLSGKQLNGTISPILGNLSFLTESLNLSINGFYGEIPTSLTLCKALRAVDLSENLLSGTIPSSFGNLTNLQGLFLNNNQLTGNIPTQLGGLTTLKFLRLHAYEQFNNSSDFTRSQFDWFPAIEVD